MDIKYSGETGSTSGNSYFIKFNQPISVLSNRNYTIEATIHNEGFFSISGNNKISLILYGNSEINIIDDIILENNNIEENKNLNLKTVFSVPDNTGQQFVYMGILVETDTDFNIGNSLYVFDMKYTGQDILVKDVRKDNMLIEQNFNSSIECDLQKLRIYTKALNGNEITHNAKIEIVKNPYLQWNVKKGGRIIYR